MTGRRCQEWLHVTRSDLWSSVHTRSSSQATRSKPAVDEEDFGLPSSVSARVCSLIQEGVLLCFSNPPISLDTEFIHQLHLLHAKRVSPTPGHLALGWSSSGHR